MMADWQITFLVTGFEVEESFHFGRVTFAPPVSRGAPEVLLLEESARFAHFGYRPDVFARATVAEHGDDYRTAARRALYEIDRTLDVMAFTHCGRSKYLPVGYASGDGTHALAYAETFPPMPLMPYTSTPKMNPLWTHVARRFFQHSEHLLARRANNLSESERALGAGLRWCRLGSLARTFSESVTVAFVMEWLALEAMIVAHAKERVADSLARLPVLMRHWPTDITDDYTPSLRAGNLDRSTRDWKHLIDSMYRERREIFHGREFNVPVDPSAMPSWERGATSFAALEAILGRCVAFLGKTSRSHPTLRRVWESVEAYAPTDDDCPPTNLGGWTRVGP